MLDKLINERVKKLEKIKDAGRDAYPIKTGRSSSIHDALDSFSVLEKSKKSITLAGRIRSMRDMGAVMFLDIYDGTETIQIVSMKKGTDHYDFWKDVIDIGDFVEARGILFKTKRGEKSLHAKKLKTISKSLRPIPVEHFGLKDEEEKLRKRYLDILLDENLKISLSKRSEVIQTLRETLWSEDFIEVETPVLQPIPGGALAEPFKTHHNALDQDLYLRIAPELYLKRLLVGGFNNVFEIGRVFRNEGMDREHNPEFTMLELYWAYHDARDMIKLVKKLLKPFIKGSWKELSYMDVLEKELGKKIDLSKMKGSEIDGLFKEHVRPKIINPTILYDYPKSLSPLSKSKEDNPYITDRFQFIVEGMEIVNGFSELNDPIDQRERMEEQEKMHRGGDKEASRMDEDFLEALEYGMPPAAGIGIGIDRLATLYAGGKSLKDVIIFPTLKTKKK